MKTVLVTGGTGYIGSHTVIELLKDNHNVIIIDNYYNSDASILERMESIAGKKIKIYKNDLCNKEKLENIFSTNKIDAIIHFAAFKAVAESVSDPLKYYNNNIISLLNLLSCMEKFNIKKMVFSSSATVYGRNSSYHINEQQMFDATNPYARTKIIAEEIFKELVETNKGWEIISLRYFNPMGAHSSGMIGESPKGIPNNLIPYITQVAIGKLNKLYVFGNDYNTSDGTCIRDFIHVTDLAIGHCYALNYIFENENENYYEPINLGSGQGYSVLQMIENFEEVTGINIPYEITERRDGDIAISLADITKAQELLNWSPKHTIYEMCRDSWRWQKYNDNILNSNIYK